MNPAFKLTILAVMVVASNVNAQSGIDPAVLAKAEGGDPSAQVMVGRAYSNGNGVPEDSTTAVAWFRKAADHGFAEGEAALG